jgi:hypothetical protein
MPLRARFPPYVSDRLTVTVNNLGDGGILFLAPKGKNYLLSVIGGSNYGQGSRGGDAGNSAYWATAADPSATFNLLTGVFSPGSTYTLTIKVDDGTFTLYKGATELTSYSDPGLTHFKIGLYDDQPNTTTGSGFGPAQSFSNFHVSGKRGPISDMEPFQTSAIPEPSTWALLILGFVGLGYAGRRQARRASSPLRGALTPHFDLAQQRRISRKLACIEGRLSLLTSRRTPVRAIERSRKRFDVRASRSTRERP